MIETFPWRAVLTALLVCACVADVRSRRIPNVLVLTVLAAGVAHAALGPDPKTALLGAAAGGLVGLVLWLPAFALGAMGAGDVKLFAATAVWLGPARGAYTALVVAIVGGVLGAAWMAHVRRRGSAATPLVGRPATMPYGVAIALGALAVTWGIA